MIGRLAKDHDYRRAINGFKKMVMKFSGYIGFAHNSD